MTLPKPSLYQYRDLKYSYLSISRKLDVKLNYNWQKKDSRFSRVILHVDSCNFLNLKTHFWYKFYRKILKTNVTGNWFAQKLEIQHSLIETAFSLTPKESRFCARQGQEIIPPKPSDRLWQSLSHLMNGYRASFTGEKAGAMNEWI
jgi:hypothetical protein